MGPVNPPHVGHGATRGPLMVHEAPRGFQPRWYPTNPRIWPPGGWRSSQKTPPDPAPCPFLVDLGFQSLDLKGAVFFHVGRSFCVGGNADLQGLAAPWFPRSLFPYTPSSVTRYVMQLRVFSVQIKGIFWNLSLLSFSFFSSLTTNQSHLHFKKYKILKQVS